MAGKTIEDKCSPVKTDFSVYRSALSMPETLSRLGVETSNGYIYCPAHEERKPSCRIYDDHAFCFGCGRPFDVISMVERV